MSSIIISDQDKKAFNKTVDHPLQSFEWGDFREKTQTKVIRKGFIEKDKITNGFQLTIHRIPYTPWTIGYLPKGFLPTDKLLKELTIIGKQENCIFIQLEPNVLASQLTQQELLRETSFPLVSSFHPLFTKYTFILDLQPSEEELLKHMHPKTRYNIRIAQKHNVVVKEENTNEGFEQFWRITEETTNRQKFFAHTKYYHKLQWETLNVSNHHDNDLTSHLFLAKYNEKVLTAWIVFVFKDKLYYPYGASSSTNREVMASNLMMWEVIRFGKAKGLKQFDMWGALSDTPDTQDPWYGFHRFKQGYGATHTEFIGSFDLVINPVLYQVYKVADKTRWALIKLRK
jgi:lipid II:glycine glycyltransferase (peptidoglycan interpeptide bridge formation enzyme)